MGFEDKMSFKYARTTFYFILFVLKLDRAGDVFQSDFKNKINWFFGGLHEGDMLGPFPVVNPFHWKFVGEELNVPQREFASFPFAMIGWPSCWI